MKLNEVNVDLLNAELERLHNLIGSPVHDEWAKQMIELLLKNNFTSVVYLETKSG